MKTIAKFLDGNVRDHAVFIVGTNTNLRASDFLALTLGHARAALRKGYFEIWEINQDREAVGLKPVLAVEVEPLALGCGTFGYGSSSLLSHHYKSKGLAFRSQPLSF
jgi:hypothetical protein